MRGRWVALSGVGLVLCGLLGRGEAEIGWTLDRYREEYGPGQRGYGKIHEVGFQVGHNRLVVEFRNQRSVAELWRIVVRDAGVPAEVFAAGQLAQRGPVVDRIAFKSRSSPPAEVHQEIVDGIVVRTEMRNGLLRRLAYCGRAPPCPWWRRLLGWCETEASCPILDRALNVDRKVDELQARTERSLQRRR